MTSLMPTALHVSKARIKTFMAVLVKTAAQTGFQTATLICILLTYLNRLNFLLVMFYLIPANTR